jgi:hypothetical protein
VLGLVVLVVERIVDVVVRRVKVERVVLLGFRRCTSRVWWVWRVLLLLRMVLMLLLMLLVPCVLSKEAAERATEVAMNSGIEGVEGWVASGNVVDVGVGGSAEHVFQR